MTISLQQISEAIENEEGIENEAKAPIITGIREATETLRDVLKKMDDVPVKGRDVIDVYFGCIMALESIVGDKGE